MTAKWKKIDNVKSASSMRFGDLAAFRTISSEAIVLGVGSLTRATVGGSGLEKALKTRVFHRNYHIDQAFGHAGRYRHEIDEMCCVGRVRVSNFEVCHVNLPFAKCRAFDQALYPPLAENS